MKRTSVLSLLLICTPVLAAPFAGPPAGYTLVAEDDCGNPDAIPHVVRGNAYVFPLDLATGSPEERDIVFDNEFCQLRYEKLVAGADYKVDVVYVSQAGAGRAQSLEANGVTVHETLTIPERTPGRFIFDLPRAAYADGKPLELSFKKRGESNAVVSVVRLWSTDPTPLPGKVSLWVPSGPIEKDWLRQDRLAGRPVFAEWEDPARAIRDDVVPCIDGLLERGGRMLTDFRAADGTGIAESRAELRAVAEARDDLLARGVEAPEEWLRVYRAARWAVRRTAFRNPLLDFDQLLFVRRHHSGYMHQCARRLGAFTLPGGAICMLEGIGAESEATVTPLTEGRFGSGTFGRPDVSFDGRRIVFGYAPERAKEDPGAVSTGVTEQAAPLFAEHKVGPCEAFQVWEMDLQGRAAPRRLTEGPIENSDPLYLPDGRIAFMSHRAGGLVQCGDWALSYCVYSMNPDGSDVRQVTVSKDGEWDPFLMDDGTIGFTRWEYVMKFWSPIQMLWSVRPDGTNPRLTYGSDLSRTYAYPLNYASARPVPGTSKLICVGSAHHNTGAGPLCLVDLAIGPSEASGLERITPVRFTETPDQMPDAGWYDCPYPLSEKYYLASYSLSPDETDTRAYGLYLVDAYGGRELIYRDAELSAMFPMPLRPRRQPAVLPTVKAEAPDNVGEFYIQDVHAGLPPEMAGKARYVQVVECHERKIHTAPYAIEVGPDSGFETKTVLGTVPVDRDGSAYFRVPADKSVFFSVLDADYRALHTMRSVTNIQAGERTGCVGCHEGARRVPAARPILATRRQVSDLEAPPWGTRPMDYVSLIQPVLDRNCAQCHDGTQAGGKAPDLTAKQTQVFMGVELPVSYYNLRQQVRHAPMYTYFMAPGSFGSRVSPLMEMLAAGHHEVKLGRDDWHLLCAWIDCNAPGIGSYDVAALETARARMRAQALARRKALAEGRGSLDERSKQIAAGLSPGERLTCYVDCGPQVVDAGEGGVVLQEVAGTPFAFRSDPQAVTPWFDDISFEGTAVVYEATGLSADRQYSLGFSWWDFDGGGREQAVTVTAPDGRQAVLLPRTKLPAWSGLGEQAEVRTLAIPTELTGGGTVRIEFANAAGKANAVVSEVWLVER